MIAQRRAAERYSDGDGAAHDAHAALEWFTLAATAGDGLSQYRLGLIYETGPSPTPPHSTRPPGLAAYSPMRCGSDARRAPALLRRGGGAHCACAAGVATAVDLDEAERWFTLAATAGHADSAYHLGRMLHGKALPQDRGAARWMQQVRAWRAGAVRACWAAALPLRCRGRRLCPHAVLPHR